VEWQANRIDGHITFWAGCDLISKRAERVCKLIRELQLIEPGTGCVILPLTSDLAIFAYPVASAPATDLYEQANRMPP
jgi:hypothetical protein